jgi:hypothetical protein
MTRPAKPRPKPVEAWAAVTKDGAIGLYLDRSFALDSEALQRGWRIVHLTEAPKDTAGEVRELKKLLSLVGSSCDALHHCKKDQHSIMDPCPILLRIRKALATRKPTRGAK